MWRSPKRELADAAARLARRLSELASALAQDEGETLVVGWTQTDGWIEYGVKDGGDWRGRVHGMVFVQRHGSHAACSSIQ
jgi:hypothetical protein